MVFQVMQEAPGLEVVDLSKAFYAGPGRPVFEGLNFELGQGERLAVLGRNGQGKSTLIKILGGAMTPTAGRVIWRMSNSWPIGFGGAFQGSLSGIDNIRFLSRIYDRPFGDMLARVDDFAELGQKLKLPVKHFSSGMRARLAFGLSLAIEFDCYLIDEITAVGDAIFQARCNEELFEKRGDRAFIMASHSMELIKQTCERALIVESGKAKLFDDIGEAVDLYTWLRAA